MVMKSIVHVNIPTENHFYTIPVKSLTLTLTHLYMVKDVHTVVYTLIFIISVSKLLYAIYLSVKFCY